MIIYLLNIVGLNFKLKHAKFLKRIIYEYLNKIFQALLTSTNQEKIKLHFTLIKKISEHISVVNNVNKKWLF